MRATVNHMTWSAPEKEELKQLNIAMLLKALRVLLSVLILSAYLSLIVLIRYLDLTTNAIIGLTMLSALPVIIYYWYYRSALTFGKRMLLDDEIGKASVLKFLWFLINLFLTAPVFLIFSDKLGILCYVLIVSMAVLTYRKEIFMLILFAMKKYMVKDGDVYYRQHIRKTVATPPYRGGFLCMALIYRLDFEDAPGRKIPVMADLYTYRMFKEGGPALIINYRYRDSYMFEIIRLKR